MSCFYIKQAFRSLEGSPTDRVQSIQIHLRTTVRRKTCPSNCSYGQHGKPELSSKLFHYNPAKIKYVGKTFQVINSALITNKCFQITKRRVYIAGSSISRWFVQLEDFTVRPPCPCQLLTLVILKALPSAEGLGLEPRHALSLKRE